MKHKCLLPKLNIELCMSTYMLVNKKNGIKILSDKRNNGRITFNKYILISSKFYLFIVIYKSQFLFLILIHKNLMLFTTKCS